VTHSLSSEIYLIACREMRHNGNNGLIEMILRTILFLISKKESCLKRKSDLYFKCAWFVPSVKIVPWLVQETSLCKFLVKNSPLLYLTQSTKSGKDPIHWSLFYSCFLPVLIRLPLSRNWLRRRKNTHYVRFLWEKVKM
jgi:hypothetical protein